MGSNCCASRKVASFFLPNFNIIFHPGTNSLGEASQRRRGKEYKGRVKERIRAS